MSNPAYLATLTRFRTTAHRLDRIRDAVRLHRQQLIGTSELYAVIETDDAPPAEKPARREDTDVLVPHGDPIDIGWINGSLDARLQLSVRPGMDPIERDQLLADLRDTIAALVPVRSAKSGCWCGHPEHRHWTNVPSMTIPNGCHDCRGWDGAHIYGQELPWQPGAQQP